MEAETMDRIVDTLFPAHPKRSVDPKMPENLKVPMFTEAELRRACGRLEEEESSGTGRITGRGPQGSSEKSSGPLA